MNSQRTDSGLRLAREIIALEAQLEEKREEFARLIGGEPRPATRTHAPKRVEMPKAQTKVVGAFMPKGQLKPGSASDRVLSVMKTKPGHTWTPVEIAEAGKDIDQRMAAAEAGRLVRGKFVERVKHGHYRYNAPKGGTAT